MKFLVIASIVLIAIVQICRHNVEQFKATFSQDKVVFIPSPHGIKLISLGFDQLLADCYWLLFVSYVGDTPARENDKFAYADEYLDLITGLDPYLVKAYWFAAFTVGYEQRRPNKAAELIERGIRANQDNWYLPFIAGINQYLYAGNEVTAAKYYRQAAKYPEAPKWLSRQASILESKIPSKVKEINVWSNIYYSETEPRVREMAKQKLIGLWGQIIASHPPRNISNKAIAALKDLGVDIDFYINHMRKQK
ncbi:MAG: hypothetical protein KIT34_00455 [Cyanobacteria bacterium TGS_CYA1]|nr:hypothetical protein [Cyanobacteria bacterium TGS_CYA1]